MVLQHNQVVLEGQQPVIYQGQDYNPATYGQVGQQVLYATPVEVQEAPGAPYALQAAPQQQIVALPNGAPEVVYGGQIVPSQQQVQIVQQQEPAQQLQVVQQQQPVQVVQQQVVQGSVKHVPLAKCRVLYLGCAVPLATAVGLEAIQGPLTERYTPDSNEMQGIDAWLTIFSSGMLLKFCEDDTAVHWFPISSLHVCAAVKAISLNMSSGAKQTRFVALDSEHGQKSCHPPLFSAIMRRTKGRKVLECHAFICKSNQAAMALVQSCTHAYEHKEGWCDDAPPLDMAEGHDPMRLLAAEPAPPRDAPNEYYNPIPQHGYFYTPNQGLVKNYAVNGNKEKKQPQPQVIEQQAIVQPPVQVVPQLPQQHMQTVLEPVLVQVGGPQQPQVMMPQVIGPQVMGPQVMGPPRPELAQYFGDWNAFPGYPVAILGGQPMPPKPKKKKKKKKRSDGCCTEDACGCATDDCCQDVFNKQEYFVDHYYDEYNKRRKEKRREREERRRDRDEERHRDDRRTYDNHHSDSFPPRRRDDRRRDDYIVRREPDHRDVPQRPRWDPYYDDPYIRDYYSPPEFYQPARAPVYQDDFHFYGPGYAYGGYGDYGGGYGGYGYDDYYGGYGQGYDTGYGQGYGNAYQDPYAGGYGGYGGYDPNAYGDQFYDGFSNRFAQGTRLY